MSRSSRAEMRTLLGVAGRAPVPPRATGTLAAMPSDPGTGVVTVESPPDDELSRRRERRRQPALVGVAAAIVALMLAGTLTGLFASGGDDSGGRPLALVQAVDTTVVLPDGTSLDGARGVALPDGTRLLIGLDGFATVAGVRLGPGTEAIVRDGRVVVLAADEPTDGDAGAGANDAGTSGSDADTAGDPTTGTGGSSDSDGSTPDTAPPLLPAPLPPVVVPPVPTLPTLPLPRLGEVLPNG